MTYTTTPRHSRHHSHQAPAYPAQCLFPWYVWAIAVAFGVLNTLAHLAIAHPDDLSAWWVAARLVAEGQLDAIYSIDPNDFSRPAGPEWQAEAELIKDTAPFVHPYVHIPLIAYLLSFITHVMSFSTFATIWAFISGVSFVLLASASISLWTRRAVPPAIIVGVTSALWISAAGQMSLDLGQTSPFIYALVAVSLALSQRRPWAAGLLIAVAALIKITPLALIVGMILFASRRKTGLVGLGGFVAGYVVSWLWAGSGVTTAWKDTVGWINSKTLTSPVNASIDSLLQGISDLSAVVGVVDGTSPWAFAIKLVIVIAMLVGLFMVVGSRSDYAFEVSAVTVLLVGTAVSGVVWTHYGLLTVLPLAGAMILHRSWFASAVCLLMFPPFGEVFVSEDRTPLALHSAALLVLLIPTAILVWGVVSARSISGSDIIDGVRGEVLGWKANSLYPATLSWAAPVGSAPAQKGYRVPEMARPRRSAAEYRAMR